MSGMVQAGKRGYMRRDEKSRLPGLNIGTYVHTQSCFLDTLAWRCYDFF